MNNKPAFVLPTIHLNGTGAQTLFNDALAARSAVVDALDAMRRTEFNARDYYVVDGAWEKAVAQRRDMMAELERQAAYWLAVAELAQDEIHRRNP